MEIDNTYVPQIVDWDPAVTRPQAYNGLCTCRGTLEPHPFHNTTRPLGDFPSRLYIGKHRKPGY